MSPVLRSAGFSVGRLKKDESFSDPLAFPEEYARNFEKHMHEDRWLLQASNDKAKYLHVRELTMPLGIQL